MLIRCLHIRDFNTTPVFQSVAHAEIDKVESLMMTGQASILDVNALGESLLQVISILYLSCLHSLHELTILT